MEMGTGKSKVLLDNVAMLYDKGKINALLIIEKGVYKIGMTQKYQHIYQITYLKNGVLKTSINLQNKKEFKYFISNRNRISHINNECRSFFIWRWTCLHINFYLHNAMIAIDELQL